ncbi:MAG: hypothetical protein OWU33_03070 [Firmicutes bacterium]|nr:hypothetical protein [Bacillota bacterium]
MDRSFENPRLDATVAQADPIYTPTDAPEALLTLDWIDLHDWVHQTLNVRATAPLA